MQGQAVAILSAFGRLHQNVKGDGAHTLMRVASTCREMLVDRGFRDISTEDPVVSIVEERPVLRASDPSAVALFLHPDRVGIKFVRALLDRHSTATVIIVSVNGCTSFTKKECVGFDVQFFLARDLFVNVTKHKLVPQHHVVTAPDCPAKAEHLPKILTTDPICQYYAWPPGTVVKVLREWVGSQPIPYFRVVAEA